MTTSADDRRARYVATASQTSFDVDFPIDTSADIKVWHKVNATGVVTLLTLTTDYTVTLDGAAPNTADVDLVTGAAVNDIITIEGDRTAARADDYTTGGDFLAGTVNTAEDRQYWHIQEKDRDLDRALKVHPVGPDTFDPTFPDPTGNASKYLRVNSAETALEMAQLAATGTSVASDATPVKPTAAGTAGTGDDFSREDHAHPFLTKGSDIASATTIAIAAGSDYFDVTGTTTITGMTVAAGTWFILQTDGALQFTDGASLDVGGANLLSAAGDRFIFYATAADTVNLVGHLQEGDRNYRDRVLARPVLKDYGETVNAIGDFGGGTQDIDLESGNVVSATVSTATVTFTFSNPPASGTEGGFKVYLTNGGSQTVNWPASVDWAGATPPTLTAAGVDVLVFTTIDGGTIWNGFLAGADMS